jgi:tetratricopeptide (TPR) repeat protein
MIKRLVKIPLVIACSLFVSCSPSAKIAQLSEEAKMAYEQKQFEIALAKYEQAISLKKKESEKVPFYEGAGQTAYALNNTEKALQYLEKARMTRTANEITYYTLSKIYREIDNLSKEITTLQSYVDKFPDGQEYREVQNRLFETLVESQNYEQALELWERMGDSAGNDENILTGYLKANIALKNDDESDKTAIELLKINKNNVAALDRMAKKYFWLAENRYIAEMKAYENNKTRRQYAQLLAAFESLNKDFRTSLNYFLRLYELSPSIEYAQFIGNIYIRFDDKQKADYYLKRAKQ